MREIAFLGIVIPEVSFETMLLVGRAIFLVFCFILAAVAFTRWRRSADVGTQRLFEETRCLIERLSGIEQQIAAANARIGELSRLTEVAERLEGELHRTSTGTAAAPSYQIAIRLARSGASAEEVMQNCGITRQEAELVQRLHAPRRASGLRTVAAG